MSSRPTAPSICTPATSEGITDVQPLQRGLPEIPCDETCLDLTDLFFSIECYEEVVDSYLRGLADARAPNIPSSR